MATNAVGPTGNYTSNKWLTSLSYSLFNTANDVRATIHSTSGLILGFAVYQHGEHG